MRAPTHRRVMPDRFDIAIANEQSRHAVDEDRLREAVLAVLHDSDFATASISIAVVDDPTIHELNRRHLEHDYPTDVLSFPLEDSGDHLAGEIILSADTAATSAAEIGWAAAAEQLLYVVHGVLHLVGYRDKTPAETLAMREAEARYLQQLLPLPPEEGRGEGESRNTEALSPCPLPEGEGSDSGAHVPGASNAP